MLSGRWSSPFRQVPAEATEFTIECMTADYQIADLDAVLQYKVVGTSLFHSQPGALQRIVERIKGAVSRQAGRMTLNEIVQDREGLLQCAIAMRKGQKVCRAPLCDRSCDEFGVKITDIILTSVRTSKDSVMKSIASAVLQKFVSEMNQQTPEDTRKLVENVLRNFAMTSGQNATIIFDSREGGSAKGDDLSDLIRRGVAFGNPGDPAKNGKS